MLIIPRRSTVLATDFTCVLCLLTSLLFLGNLVPHFTILALSGSVIYVIVFVEWIRPFTDKMNKTVFTDKDNGTSRNSNSCPRLHNLLVAEMVLEHQLSEFLFLSAPSSSPCTRPEVPPSSGGRKGTVCPAQGHQQVSSTVQFPPSQSPSLSPARPPSGSFHLCFGVIQLLLVAPLPNSPQCSLQLHTSWILFAINK